MSEQELPATTPPRRTRRYRRAIAVVLVVGLAGWLLAAGYGRSRVYVLVDALPLVCEGTEVVVGAAGGGSTASADGVAVPGEEVMVPYAVVRAGMRCTFRFRVENRGLLPARVHRVSLPFHGPDSGGSWVRAAHLDHYPATVLDDPRNLDQDAVFALEEAYPLAAGEVVHFSVELVYRPPACLGGSRPRNSAVVTVSALGIPGGRTHVGEAYGLRCVRG